MRLEFNPDEGALYEVFKTFFEKECPPEKVRKAEPLGFDPDLWEKLKSMGAHSMALPESSLEDTGGGKDGVEGRVEGGGGSLFELAVVVELAGRHLAPVPLIEHSVATRLLTRCEASSPDQQLSQVLGGLFSGEQISTLALAPVKNGIAPICPAGAIADIVIGLKDDEIILVQNSPSLEGIPNLADMPLADIDMSTPDITLAPSSAHKSTANDSNNDPSSNDPSSNDPNSNDPSIQETSTSSLFREAISEWHCLGAVAMAGMGLQVLEITLDYVKEREQFGKPIGAFQAIQQGLADVAVQLRGAYLLAQKAVWNQILSPNKVSTFQRSRAAFLFTSKACLQATAAAIQYHGGFGYAEEYDVQLYHRRAKGLQLVAGSPNHHYQELANGLFN